MDNVRLMAAEHLALVPIGPGTKHPPIEEWQLKATDDSAIHETWWGEHPAWGLGWKMGLQPDGRDLVAIDVDVKKGGKESFTALLDEFDVRDEFLGTTTALTGGGGYHFIFEWPPDAPITPVNRSKLRAGIDIRAEGGQIVVAPTVHPDTGKPYAWQAGKAPWELPPQVAGTGVLTMVVALLAPPPRLTLVGDTGPRFDDIDSAADWVRANLDFFTFLSKYGWVFLDGEAWRRPGKTDRGSSAQLKNAGSGPLNVFTTDIPSQLERLGHPDGTGQCLSFSLFELIAGYEFGGDMSACARWVRSTYMDDAVQNVRARILDGWDDGGAVTVSVASTVPAPPEWVWSSSEVMAQIAQAARSVGKSPSALWLTMWLHWMTAIPTSFLIPDFLGYTATFDAIGCVTGRSGGGKTTLSGMARKLVDLANPVTGEENVRLWVGAPDPTGEGLMEAFLHRERGKKAERVFDGIHFVMDEGTVFIEGSKKDGATIIGNLCKAWSGSLTGTTTASAERKRWFDPQSIRVTALVSMQVAHGWKMLDKHMSDTGLAQRMVFAHSVDPHKIAVADRPERITTPILTMPRKLFAPTYAPEIIDEVVEDDANADDLDPLDTHRNLNRLKLAWPFAAIEGRGVVTGTDWSIATAFMDYSTEVRSLLLSSRESSQRDERYTVAENRADADLHYEDAKARGRLTRRAERLQRHLKKHGPKGESDAIRGTFGSDERHDAETVVAWGLHIGLFERLGDQLVSR